ncbi:MAG: hypothetical protein H2045_09065 [Rhizobiales bacterium]|nr:hypothetical protein [Hyphomicrobiales bacterium]
MWDCRPGRWVLPGFVTVLLLTLVAMILRADLIEGDLASRALQNLATEDSWAKVELDGRDLTLSGTAPSVEAKARALRLADGAFGDKGTGTWGVRVVNGASIADLPVQSPYATGAALSDNGIKLMGFVPSELLRTEIAAKAAATFADKKIDDAMQLAAGAPAGLAPAMAFSASQLKHLSSGTFTLSDGALTISGIAAGDADYDAVSAALSGPLPDGMTLASANIMPPKLAPYPFAASRAANTITLTGRVPSNVVRQSLIDRAQALFTGAKVSDQLKLASGEPSDFADKAGFAIDQLKLPEEVAASLSDSTLNLTGKASTADIATSVRTALRGVLPFGLGLGDLTISAPEAPPVAKVEAPTPPPAPAAVSEAPPPGRARCQGRSANTATRA